MHTSLAIRVTALSIGLVVCLLEPYVLGSGNSESIPRSTHTHRSATGEHDYRIPPWNPSPMIDENGFLLKLYKRIPGEWEKDMKGMIRSSRKSKHRKKKRKDSKKEGVVATIDDSSPSDENERIIDRSNKRNTKDDDDERSGGFTLPVTTIRQVPGDGNCLFHSISTCYAFVMNDGTHLDLRSKESLKWLYSNSAKLRQQAVDCLEQKRRLLFLQGHEYLKASDLVDAAASQYGISGTEYCTLMRQDSYWGGGPEIVALCNVLQRPIHVYELHVVDNNFVLRRMACFGSPKFDKQQALHILSADSRFPDVVPGQQHAAGNHFLAMFPELSEKEKKKREKKKKKEKLRGGDNAKTTTSVSTPSSTNKSTSSKSRYTVKRKFSNQHPEDVEEEMKKNMSTFRPTGWWRRLSLSSQSQSNNRQ